MKIFIKSDEFLSKEDKRNAKYSSIYNPETDNYDYAIYSMPPTLLQKVIDNILINANHDFSGIDFTKINFKNLREAGCLDFSNCNFNNCNLSGVDLSDAILDNADFTNANLTDANLSNTSLEDTKFTGTILKNCCLFEASNVDYNNIIESSSSYIEDLNFKELSLKGKNMTKSGPKDKTSSSGPKDKTSSSGPKDKTSSDEEVLNDTSEISFSPTEIKKYSVYLPVLSDLARKGLKKIIRWSLRKFGKSKKVIDNYISVAMDFLDTYKDEANQILQFVIGFVASQLHRVKNLGSISENTFLKKLSGNNLRKFGEYALAQAHGSFIGDLINKVIAWCTAKLFGSPELIRIAAALENPKELAKISKEMDSEEENAAEEEALKTSTKNKTRARSMAN